MSGIQRISMERQRQIEQEGWAPEHDDRYVNHELKSAARCYLLAAHHHEVTAFNVPTLWPWAPEWWKPSDDPVRNLEKAGALIAAEIDRINRELARNESA